MSESVKPSTRQSENVYLLGIKDIEPLNRMNQLPTLRQVLLRFHNFLSKEKSVRNASHSTIEELIVVWNKAFIPVRLESHCVEKLEKVHSKWLLIKKNRGRKTETQKLREVTFTNDLDKLFDIAHSESDTICKVPQDRDFLNDQRAERKMIITSEDKEFNKKLARIQKRKESEAKRLKVSSEGAASNIAPDFKDVNSEFTDTSLDSEDSDECYRPAEKKRISKSDGDSSESATKQRLFTKHVTGALDRNKVSDREALRLIVPLASALGHEPSSMSISRSTIRRERIKARKSVAEEIKASFLVSGPVVVHWDGKILPDIVGSEKVDRLPVLVSVNGEDKLLGVPKLQTGTGVNCTNAVYQKLEEWNLVDKISGICFDTTAVNTGRINGACTLLEKQINRELLWFACRHHMLEIVLSKVFTLCFGPSNSPEIPLFKRLKSGWNLINTAIYQGLDQFPDIEYFKETAIEFLISVVEKKSQPRDDYMEVVELALLVLGHALPKVHWRSPGPIHHARWMAKLIYAFKMYLFRQQGVFKLTRKEEQNLERFVKFGALVYVKNWIEAPRASDSPVNDLRFWQDMDKMYQQIDPAISRTVKQALQPHLWYLSDELIGLSLFSDKVSVEEKIKIVDRMMSDVLDRKVRGDSSLLSDESILADFVTKRTKQSLKKLQINDEFLSLHPKEWEENSNYIEAKKIVNNIKVVNDIAERGVKLIQDFNQLITKDEEEKQLLLQIVELNRKCVPTRITKKSAIESVTVTPSTSKD